MQNELVRSIASQIGTPFYIAYPDRFLENICNFRDAFLNEYDKFILSYSFKTNYAPFILHNILDYGFYAEVVSDMEYDLALSLGFKKENIIFNGPIKTEEYILKAIKNNSIINLDSVYEIGQIISLFEKGLLVDANVGLRINMELKTDNGKSAIHYGLKESRFGFTMDMLDIVIPRLKKYNIKIISLHGHTSSTNRVVENYQIISERMLYVCDIFNLLDIKYFDIGGGFFGAAPKEIDTTKKPTYSDYAKGVMSILKNNNWFKKVQPFLVIEPGASVTSNTLELVTKVYQHKNIDSKNFIVVDATVLQVKPLMSKVNYPFECLSNNEEDPEIIADIVGSTCMESDIIATDVPLKHYSKEDLYVFKAVGAYRINMTPNFINYQLPIVSVSVNGEWRKIRDRQTLNQVKQIFAL